jgi:hypothetical protein
MNGNSKSILMVIAVVLVAILGVLVYQGNVRQQTPGEKIQSGLNQAADGVGDAVQNAGNNIKREANR